MKSFHRSKLVKRARLFLMSRKAKLIGLFAVALIALLGFGIYNAMGSKSPEDIKSQQQVFRTIIDGFSLKHLATVDSNKDKVDQFRQQLPDYYSNVDGELTDQQRLITAYSDTSVKQGMEPPIAEKNYLDDKQKILGFRFISFKPLNASIGEVKAKVKAQIEYYLDRQTLSQQYPTDVSNIYVWELAKIKGKWLITNETLDTTDDNKSNE